MDTTWVQAIIDHRLYPLMPGSIIRLWGFDFKIYTDKSLCLEMHNDFVRHEVRAGHVKVMPTPPPGVVEVKIEVPKQKKVEIKIERPQFTLDVKDYYGLGNVNDLIEEVNKLTVKELKDFIDQRFEVTLPRAMLKSDILEEIRTLTDLEFVKAHKDDEGEE